MTSPNTAAARHLSRLSTSSSTRSSPRNAGRDASNVCFTASTKSVSSTGSSKSQMTPRAQTPTSLSHRSLRSGSHGSISLLRARRTQGGKSALRGLRNQDTPSPTTPLTTTRTKTLTRMMTTTVMGNTILKMSPISSIQHQEVTTPPLSLKMKITHYSRR